MSLHKIVVAAIIEYDGKVLVHQRPQGKWGAGKWELPGGKLEPGEAPREALARECREELGVEVHCGAIHDVTTWQYEDIGPVILIFIHATLVDSSSANAVCSIEGGAVEWAERGDLLGYDWLAADVPVLKTLIQ